MKVIPKAEVIPPKMMYDIVKDLIDKIGELSIKLDNIDKKIDCIWDKIRSEK